MYFKQYICQVSASFPEAFRLIFVFISDDYRTTVNETLILNSILICCGKRICRFAD
ncbi:hypothetical protein THOG05_330017 [Vibrio rotiferianus]|nr:hypothetical protein THOG05_330017 [Vibrio rotiferianus]